MKVVKFIGAATGLSIVVIFMLSVINDIIVANQANDDIDPVTIEDILFQEHMKQNGK
ncbi:hypothetical protein [Staphylococcus sp. LKG3-3]|uniref:hypothetical protein n=1 Tax=Staphylococcus sp. LKG3-3 TaxID=3399685 RepID=UPI003D523508